MPDCLPIANVTLDTTFIGTSLSDSFSAPSTLGAHTLTANGDLTTERVLGNIALCVVSAHFDVVAATSTPTSALPTASSEPGTGPGETQAGTAPISATPLHVTG
jgi:hypothetical protein